MFKTTATYLPPQAWGLEVGPTGELLLGGYSTVALAQTYGTPLHVVHEARLQETARHFLRALQDAWPGEVSVHFAFKCNSVPGVVRLIREAGLKAEVMSDYELELALRLGYSGREIIINGPHKTDALLEKCLRRRVRYIIIDSLSELERLDRLCNKLTEPADVLLRINPDFVPRGMNQGSATGSRRGCAFGLDLKDGEVERALDRLKHYDRIRFDGFHLHIGTGIRRPEDYRRALQSLSPIVRETRRRGFVVRAVDIGGGLAARTSREMTTREMLLYEAFDLLPAGVEPAPELSFEQFAGAVREGLQPLFPAGETPELLVEPGRCIASSNQLLLLTIHDVKERPGIRKWLLTDGGIGTATMPTYYEYHEVFLCNDVRRPRSEKVTIIGPVCFASDVVYRNKPMPPAAPGEVLAIMDSGAYFTAWESSFGFPRPAVAGVRDGRHRLLRRRENFQDMIGRDQGHEQQIGK